MSKNEKIEYFNGLLAKYLENKATPDEIAFIEKYYKYFESGKDLTDLLSKNETNQVQNRMLEKIKAGIAEKNTKVISLKRRRIAWTAAASVLLIAGSLFFFQLNRQKANSNSTSKIKFPPSQDIAPGSNKATITLGDGSQVFLNDSTTGIIARQGNTKVVRLSTGEVVYNNNKVNSKAFINTMTTPRGGRYQLMLSDGTKVWMNSESSITYPTAFSESERRVKITGEVYFEVAKNEKQPFFVDLNDGTEIRVLGTHFNVNTYQDNGSITTTLLEGSVRINNKSTMQMLKPGQQAEVNNNTISVNGNVDIDQVMAWKDGNFSFNDTKLEAVMKQLSRWYDMNIIYEGKIPQMKFWGGISMNSPLSLVLEILEESKVNFRIENKNLIVLSK